jgi:Zn-dependent protease with chaperone function
MFPELSPAVLSVGLIPLLWSGAVAVLRTLASRRSSVSIAGVRVEATILGSMLAPLVAGTVLFVLAANAPTPALTLLHLKLASLSPSAPLGGDITTPLIAAPGSHVWRHLSIVAISIYLVGLGVCLTKLIRAHVSLHRIATSSVPCPGLGKDVRLSVKSGVPFACGLGVIIPSALAERLTARELSLVVRHEQAHIKRGDPIAYWTLAWIDALAWHNPFIRRQTALCRLAAELACDAIVMAGAPGLHAAYAGTLIAAVRHATDAPPWAPGMSSSGSRREHHIRIMRIMSDAPMPARRLGRTLPAALALLFLVVCGLQLIAYASSAPSVISFQLRHEVPGGGSEPVPEPRKMPNNPGSEGSVRRMSYEFPRGEPPRLAAIMRQVFTKLGPIESMTFVGVYPSGADVFDVRHANGIVRWAVTLSPNGSTSSVSLLRKLDSGDTVFWRTVNP